MPKTGTGQISFLPLYTLLLIQTGIPEEVWKDTYEFK